MDRIERYMRSYENGERIEVRVNESRTATLLARYYNAVQAALNRGDPSGLAEFKGKAYLDADGREHTFETDLDALREIAERSESDFGAIADIYVDQGEAAEMA